MITLCKLQIHVLFLSGLMVYGIFLQYANSKNCKMEFRFAVAKLKIPTILAVVGTGYNWERSEVSQIY